MEIDDSLSALSPEEQLAYSGMRTVYDTLGVYADTMGGILLMEDGTFRRIHSPVSKHILSEAARALFERTVGVRHDLDDLLAVAIGMIEIERLRSCSLTEEAVAEREEATP